MINRVKKFIDENYSEQKLSVRAYVSDYGYAFGFEIGKYKNEKLIRRTGIIFTLSDFIEKDIETELSVCIEKLLEEIKCLI